jgi:cobalt-zinc-cadmium efflux system outer membrane protein
VSRRFASTVALSVALLATRAGAAGAPVVPTTPVAQQPGAPTNAPTDVTTPTEPELTMDQAVGIALARNRDVIAAKLQIRDAELDRVEAGLYWNPTLQYSAGNIVLGHGNYGINPGSPGPFSEVVQSVGVSDVIDVWAKRGARMHTADLGIQQRRLVVEDALREIVHDVRSAFADVAREQSERDLSRETRDRYADTVRLSRSRFGAGEISEAELSKIELEGLKYENAVIDAEQEYDVARQKLAAILGIGTELPFHASFPVPRDENVSLPALLTDALARRPDLLAARADQRFATAALTSARREALPDISLGVGYTHSGFQASGDNPNTLAVTLSAPLPIFDRNQAGIGRAELAITRAENDTARIELVVRSEVTEAVRRLARATSLLAVYEGGGMLKRSSSALNVAEKSYKAGAISLLELLEARRTYIDTQASYLRAQHDLRQSTIDLAHSVGESPK